MIPDFVIPLSVDKPIGATVFVIRVRCDGSWLDVIRNREVHCGQCLSAAVGVGFVEAVNEALKRPPCARMKPRPGTPAVACCGHCCCSLIRRGVQYEQQALTPEGTGQYADQAVGSGLTSPSCSPWGSAIVIYRQSRGYRQVAASARPRPSLAAGPASRCTVGPTPQADLPLRRKSAGARPGRL